VRYAKSSPVPLAALRWLGACGFRFALVLCLGAAALFVFLRRKVPSEAMFLTTTQKGRFDMNTTTQNPQDKATATATATATAKNSAQESSKPMVEEIAEQLQNSLKALFPFAAASVWRLGASVSIPFNISLEGEDEWEWGSMHNSPFCKAIIHQDKKTGDFEVRFLASTLPIKPRNFSKAKAGDVVKKIVSQLSKNVGA
jgi:hypothetical protein